MPLVHIIWCFSVRTVLSFLIFFHRNLSSFRIIHKLSTTSKINPLSICKDLMDSWLCSFLNIKCTEWRPYSFHFQLLLHFQQLFSVISRQLCCILLHFFIHKTVNIQYNYLSLPSFCQTIQFWCIRDITNMTQN